MPSLVLGILRVDRDLCYKGKLKDLNLPYLVGRLLDLVIKAVIIQLSTYGAAQDLALDN